MLCKERLNACTLVCLLLQNSLQHRLLILPAQENVDSVFQLLDASTLCV